MSRTPKAPLLRRLTSKSSQRRRGQGSSESSSASHLDSPSSLTLSNVSSGSTSATPALTPATIQIGTQQVSLPTLCVGGVLFLIFLLLSRAFLTFSASIFRFTVLVLILAGVYLFTQFQEKQRQQQKLGGGAPKTGPGSAGLRAAPDVDDGASELLNHYRRIHERQSSLR